MYDIIIVGAGVAGLTAAIYARRADKKVLVLEALSYGGQIVNAANIENYPVVPHISGFDFATKLYNQARDLGVEFRFEKVVQISENKEVITIKNKYKAMAIILATGSFNRKLGIENEEKFIGKGVSYCATCDGAFYKGKRVAIQGGGNTAIEDALYLSNVCEVVYLIHRRDEFRAEQGLVNRLKKKSNVKLILNSSVVKLNGTEQLSSIELLNSDGSSQIMDVSGLFVAIGRKPENECFKNIIDLDDKGYVNASEDCHTNIDGIYVAGDNRTKKVRQLVTAAGDGAVAATEAVDYINKKMTV